MIRNGSFISNEQGIKYHYVELSLSALGILTIALPKYGIYGPFMDDINPSFENTGKIVVKDNRISELELPKTSITALVLNPML